MNANIRKTQSYYSAIKADSVCSCSDCRNYTSHIRAEYPKVSAYLASLGIDIEKPFELSPLEPDEGGILEYCACQYIVFGSCEDSYQHRIGNVEFRAAAAHPSTGIEEEHFVLEFSPIQLKLESPLQGPIS